jgi:hypothetical protein
VFLISEGSKNGSARVGWPAAIGAWKSVAKGSDAVLSSKIRTLTSVKANPKKAREEVWVELILSGGDGGSRYGRFWQLSAKARFGKM